MSRNLEKADPFLRVFIPLLIKTVKERLGVDVFVVDVDRDYKVQAAYYAQGRETIHVVNNLRLVAGLPLITVAENKNKITWTLNSKHITNMDDDTDLNDLSRAIDIGLKDSDGKYRGTGNEDLNGDGKHDYEQIGAIIEELGKGKVKWGGRFGDEPHLEIS